jgi:hypothetical protein
MSVVIGNTCLVGEDGSLYISFGDIFLVKLAQYDLYYMICWRHLSGEAGLV